MRVNQERIAYLLRSTDLPMHTIALRMGCSCQAVVHVNKREKIRQYKGGHLVSISR